MAEYRVEVETDDYDDYRDAASAVTLYGLSLPIRLVLDHPGDVLKAEADMQRIAALLTRDDAETPPLDQPLTKRLRALAGLLRGCEQFTNAEGTGTASPRLTLADLDRMVALLTADDERKAADYRTMRNAMWHRIRSEGLQNSLNPKWTSWAQGWADELPTTTLDALEAAYRKAKDEAQP